MPLATSSGMKAKLVLGILVFLVNNFSSASESCEIPEIATAIKEAQGRIVQASKKTKALKKDLPSRKWSAKYSNALEFLAHPMESDIARHATSTGIMATPLAIGMGLAIYFGFPVWATFVIGSSALNVAANLKLGGETYGAIYRRLEPAPKTEARYNDEHAAEEIAFVSSTDPSARTRVTYGPIGEVQKKRLVVDAKQILDDTRKFFERFDTAQVQINKEIESLFLKASSPSDETRYQAALARKTLFEKEAREAFRFSKLLEKICTDMKTDKDPIVLGSVTQARSKTTLR